MNKYELSLKQVCLQCKTKPNNCNKKKCTRYNNLKELVNKEYERQELIEWFRKEINDLAERFEDKIKKINTKQEELNNEN